MRFDVTPTVKVNEAEFGMARAQVRALMGQPKSEFRKSVYSVNTTDEYDSCHAYYDEDDRLEAIEIFDGEVYVGDALVFPADLATAHELIPGSEIDAAGLVSVAQSIFVYAPGAMDETVPHPEVEGIMFARRGYLDE